MNILFGYAISFGANLHEGIRVKSYTDVSFIVDAVSCDEAIGKAVSMAKAKYPTSDGYSGHWGISVSVSFSLDYINEKIGSQP